VVILAFFFQADDGIRDFHVTGVQTCALPIFPDTRNGAGRTFCAVLRDLTAWKKAERELLDAKRAAERASTQKSDFLARISHEVRDRKSVVEGRTVEVGGRRGSHKSGAEVEGG